MISCCVKAKAINIRSFGESRNRLVFTFWILIQTIFMFWEYWVLWTWIERIYIKIEILKLSSLARRKNLWIIWVNTILFYPNIMNPVQKTLRILLVFTILVNIFDHYLIQQYWKNMPYVFLFLCLFSSCRVHFNMDKWKIFLYRAMGFFR